MAASNADTNKRSNIHQDMHGEGRGRVMLTSAAISWISDQKRERERVLLFGPVTRRPISGVLLLRNPDTHTLDSNS